jgi:hypothetical protein
MGVKDLAPPAEILQSSKPSFRMTNRVAPPEALSPTLSS